jgi:hypothetical protein
VGIAVILSVNRIGVVVDGMHNREKNKHEKLIGYEHVVPIQISSIKYPIFFTLLLLYCSARSFGQLANQNIFSPKKQE